MSNTPAVELSTKITIRHSEGNSKADIRVTALGPIEITDRHLGDVRSESVEHAFLFVGLYMFAVGRLLAAMVEGGRSSVESVIIVADGTDAPNATVKCRSPRKEIVPSLALPVSAAGSVSTAIDQAMKNAADVSNKLMDEHRDSYEALKRGSHGNYPDWANIALRLPPPSAAGA